MRESMKRNLSSPGPLLLAGIIGLSAGAALSWLAREILEKRLSHEAELDTMGGVREGAVSETIGGHPEDMNGMPPAIEPEAATPVYDGSDLSAGQAR